MDPNAARKELSILRTTPLTFDELARLCEPTLALQRFISQLSRDTERLSDIIEGSPKSKAFAGS